MHGTAQQKKVWSSEDAEAIAKAQGALARNDFLVFRKLMHPRLLDAWWQADVAKHLMKFWQDLIYNRKPALILQAPPQHGKTDQVTDFIAWCSGQNPNVKTIFASYSNILGDNVNTALQRLFENPRYKSIFGNTRISDGKSGLWSRNSSLIEFVNYDGSFRNTTVMGQINGQGLDLGVIDDPIKGRAEASSKAVREKTWSWLTDDYFGRFSERAGLIMIMTRWHIDDPAGRWIEHFPNTKVLRYPALAEHDEEFRKKGEPLFPELKSLAFLEQRKRALTEASWESIYQQQPIVTGGELFPVERFNIVSSIDRSKIKRSVRYVDKAATVDAGAYTAASLVHDMVDGTTFVEDMLRGQWSANERDRRLMQTATTDKAVCKRYQLWIEQEPGSGGKESVESSIRMFKGFDVHADRVTGKKEDRAEPYAAQVQGGQVFLLAADWNREFLEEHEHFPFGKYKDQVDATAGAFNKLAGTKGSYDRTLSWVG